MRDPSLLEAIRRIVEGLLLDLRTSMAGTIVSFDADSMTASVRPGVYVQAVDSETVQPELDELPVFEEVPVLFPSAGGYVLYVPPEAGDPVRLEWSEEDDGDFYEDDGAATVTPRILRRHGGSLVCRSEGARGQGKLGAEDPTKAFLGTPDGRGIAIDSDYVVLGSSDASDFVALAAATQANLDLLKDTILQFVPIANDGGAALKTALTNALAPPDAWKDVASAEVKAK